MPDAPAQLAPTPALVLAAIPGAGELLTMFLWFAAAALAAVCGLYLAVAVRRWAQSEKPVGSFTLQDLRELRARGEISEQEFAALRTALLAEVQRAPEAEHPSSPPPAGAAPDDDDGSPEGSV
jgi:hypothetical protein